MRVFVAIAFLIPSVCLAIGADSTMFMGILANGNIVKIEFVSDPEVWSGHSHIYGSSTHKRFRYCWSPIVSDPSSAAYFMCSTRKGSEPSVFYRSTNWDHQNKSGPKPRYKEAMALSRKLKIDEETESLHDYYICEKGCDSTMPKFIFEVQFGGM